MRAVAGHVIDGRVVVPGEQLRNGAAVTVIVDDSEAPDLSNADIAELNSAQAGIRSGDFITADELFNHLRQKRA
jgi:hypothetical protein